MRRDSPDDGDRSRRRSLSRAEFFYIMRHVQQRRYTIACARLPAAPYLNESDLRRNASCGWSYPGCTIGIATPLAPTAGEQNHGRTSLRAGRRPVRDLPARLPVAHPALVRGICRLPGVAHPMGVAVACLMGSRLPYWHDR